MMPASRLVIVTESAFFFVHCGRRDCSKKAVPKTKSTNERWIRGSPFAVKKVLYSSGVSRSIKNRHNL